MDKKYETETSQSQVVELSQLVSSAKLFQNETEPFVTFSSGDHFETWPLRSRTAKLWIVKQYYDKNRKPPSSQALQSVLELLNAKAFLDSPSEMVFMRTALIDEKIYLDLCNSGWEVVEITKNGWEICSKSPVNFRRTKGMFALPPPTCGGNIDELKNFLNIETKEDFYLIVSWLLGALSGSGPYPLLALYGEQGCAKSTTSRVLKALIDPNASPLRSAPRKEDDLMIAANNNLILVMDNLSGIQQWLSDAFCRIATGGGLSKRELYTDSEEVTLELKRPVILNGIEELATKSDLVDRLIIIDLPVIPEDRRQSEKEFWQKFEEARPRLLGVLLDAVACGLNNLKNVSLRKMPRMADFGKWIYASTASLGWNPDDVLEAYMFNRKAANDIALESSILVPYIKQIAENGWKGSASELLEKFKTHFDGDYSNLKRLPQSPNTLSNAIKRISPNLRAIGIEVERGKTSGSESERFIRIQKHYTEIDAVVAADASATNKLTKYNFSDVCDDSDGEKQRYFNELNQTSEIPDWNEFKEQQKL